MATFVDDNGISCFVDDNGVVHWVDDNGNELTCGDERTKQTIYVSYIPAPPAPVITPAAPTSPPARYHRIRCTQGFFGVFSMAEVEFWYDGNTKHSTAGKTPIASGTGGGTTAEVFDGDLTTWWYAGGGTGWIGIDFGLGNAVAVGMVALAGRSNSQYPEIWLHEYSVSDGTTWVASGIGGNTGTLLGLAGNQQKLYYFTDPAGGFMHLRCRWVDGTPGAVRLATLQVRTSVGGADVSSAAFAVITQNDNAGTKASLFDGNTATDWSSNSFPAYVNLYFSDNRTIAQVMLQATDEPPGTELNQSPDELYVDTSPDGITWTNVFTQTGFAAWTSSEIRTYNI